MKERENEKRELSTTEKLIGKSAEDVREERRTSRRRAERKWQGLDASESWKRGEKKKSRRRSKKLFPRT